MALDSKNKKVIHAHLGQEHYTTTLTAGNHELISDEPKHSGGQDKGPDPYDYLLMSLGSCTAMTVRMYADRKEWPLENVYVELLHHKKHADDCGNCEKSSSKIDHIEKEVIVEGPLSEEQVERLLEISQKCPVHRTLLSDIKISSSIDHKK